jgi:hypothetical protein
MKSFFKSALESAYFVFDHPLYDEKQKLSTIKFFFPLPMCFFFAGISIHLILDFQVLNKFFTTSPVLVKLIFGLFISALAYPFFFKFIYPLLVVENIDKNKKDKYTTFIVYYISCFVLCAILGWLSNFTRADEFRQAF